MKILDFEMQHIEEARAIAASNYKEECEYVPVLPDIMTIPDLDMFAENGLGVAAFEKDRLVGFLCCYKPWANAFNSKAAGTFSPIHAHGSVKENRSMIYKRMYQAAADKWVRQGIAYHSIALYAHDNEAINSMFTYGFGLRCVDAVRAMDELNVDSAAGVSFEEIPKMDVVHIREMRKMLSAHLGNSPCFMYSSQKQLESWLSRAETRDTRVFAARKDGKFIAFAEIADEGENFATETADMCSICGAFCLPEYRGKNIYTNLISFIISKLKGEGYKTLGVDFESFNPTANGFWLKHFTAYTNSVVRRIDECALHY